MHIGCVLHQDQFSLEHICGGMSVFPTMEKTANMLLNLILPLCVRMGCGRRGLYSLHTPLVTSMWSHVTVLYSVLVECRFYVLQISLTGLKTTHLNYVWKGIFVKKPFS